MAKSAAEICTDSLCGMMQAIQAVYPHSRLQRCIVHTTV